MKKKIRNNSNNRSNNNRSTTSSRPPKIELRQYGACNSRVIKSSDCSAWLPFFDAHAAAEKIGFKTEIGSFELTCGWSAGFTTLTLTKLKENAGFSARLIHNPRDLRELRNWLHLRTLGCEPFTGNKSESAPSSIPCLIVNYESAPHYFAEVEFNIINRILSTAAFALLNFYRKLKSRPEQVLTMPRSPAVSESLLNFATPNPSGYA